MFSISFCNSPQWTERELHSVIPNSELHSPFCASAKKYTVLDFSNKLGFVTVCVLNGIWVPFS
jgi:hypothetical protein